MDPKFVHRIRTSGKCGKNQVFDPCFDDCEPTCEEPYKACPYLCRMEGGCACKYGYLRHENGRCVPKSCAKKTSEEEEDYWAKW
ncbi:trypsin Inhibitor like cysteine rich domain protein [Ancylostoma duodenale]|uniref:Trypsin Inhibitor like cysteine rich domain protein n=1 Tax=Ancylostoma duodenale TaxID=51022 RepID=A0A0C2C9K7_9BILA|nr:trypsin Inhibitor like cysteine rich domain protein [Ancylostoma duodenale]